MKKLVGKLAYLLGLVLAVLLVACTVNLMFGLEIPYDLVGVMLHKTRDRLLEFFCLGTVCNSFMPYIAYYFGLFIIFLLAVYFTAFCLIKIFNIPKDLQPSELQKEDLPRFLPLPIPTYNEPSYIKRVLIAITQVRNFELTEHWFYIMKIKSVGTIIMIPKGFEFDGASVPKPFWIFLSPIGLLLLPGLVHDFAYNHGYLWVIDQTGTPVRQRLEISKSGYQWVPYNQSQLCKFEKRGKKDWDILFKDLCDEINKPLFIFFIARVALCLGGWIAWNSYRNARKKSVKGDPPEISESQKTCDSDHARLVKIQKKAAELKAQAQSSKQ